MRGASLNDAQRRLLKIERTLSLFRLGSIKDLDAEYAMRSITRFGGVIGSADQFAPGISRRARARPAESAATQAGAPARGRGEHRRGREGERGRK